MDSVISCSEGPGTHEPPRGPGTHEPPGGPGSGTGTHYSLERRGTNACHELHAVSMPCIQTSPSDRGGLSETECMRIQASRRYHMSSTVVVHHQSSQLSEARSALHRLGEEVRGVEISGNVGDDEFERLYHVTRTKKWRRSTCFMRS